MSRAGFAVVPAIALLSAACAQGDLNAGGTFGMTNPASTPGHDEDDTGDDDGSTSGSTGETSGGETTAGPADGTTNAADSSGGSSGAPITAGSDESSSGLAESSSSATTDADDDMGDEMPMEDDGPPPPPPDPWESCELMDCEAGSLCINVTGLRDFSPYCAPECTTDADCPYPGGDALVSCALLAEDATEPTHCAVICEFDGDVLGECPDGMQCAEVPDQKTQVALCMWP